jgi:spore coat polysaccharide biosynthesis protein SpsF (cytidylyltransferase family)/2-polyprenyl-3-methyl-5-hydroxy-6-metoxy-1,4-benzoquinol methylase/spore coat polysaccharide biosynthesis predicted glycosyltransferase SpsG
MTILIVQCRLSSTRLPRKGLLPLGGKPVLAWVLAAMKKVKADDYYVATDFDSEAELAPVVSSCGWKLFAGPKDDVLERFCLLIEQTHADTVIRATADNPFLFYEAAQSLAEQYERRSQTGRCDYITYQNLPHGSGIEILNAKSLLKAKTMTDSPYDHEHVGPALYNHQENFTSVMMPCPEQWNHPSFRTTIDTPADYRRALAIVRFLSGGKSPEESYTSDKIVSAFSEDSVVRPVLCVPCVKKGRGTGHLRRCLAIALEIGGDVYVPDSADLEEVPELVLQAKMNGLADWQIIKTLPQKDDYALIVTDSFVIDRDTAVRLSAVAPIAAIDEGSLNTNLCDFLLDIIPSYGLTRQANNAEPAFVTLPQNKRIAPRCESSDDIHSILVTVGGEDPADLVVPSATAFAAGKKNVTAIVQNMAGSAARVPEELQQYITFIGPVHNLREQLAAYDLVVTHYGFTAFEAVAAGCAVVLLGTTSLHVQLARKYGFACIPADAISAKKAFSVMEDTDSLYPKSPFNVQGTVHKDLGEYVRMLACGRRFNCPVCGASHPASNDQVLARTSRHTFRRCSNCGIQYMAWTADSENTSYNDSYFFDSYKKQYGKTYLDDFTAIKAQCIRRMSVIDFIYRGAHKAITPTVLDIGCAYGPFLDAANDAGWQVFGTDISPEAVQYVQNKLHYPAACASFPSFDALSEFGIQQFDAVTMWYVIEHFQNLDGVLRTVSKIIKNGGVFAFSTPSAAGVSARFNTQSFYEQSPTDHYTLWEPSHASAILRRYGFKVIKSVSTGHHPERFPNNKNAKSGSMRSLMLGGTSHFFHLGDTFELYCKKEKDIFNE